MSDRPDVLREYRVKLVPADRAKPLPEYPDNLGLRTKFGGQPDQIQEGEEEQPTCPRCFQKMHFVAQIDSFDNGIEYGRQEFMFGDVGMIYVWFCFECLTPHASMECY